MDDLVTAARHARKELKSHRAPGEYEAAVAAGEHTIALLEAEIARLRSGAARGDPAPAGTRERVLAGELADLYGVLGGTRREAGDLAAAAAAYDAGFRYEHDPRYGFVNSYNELNRLITRILLCPGALADPDLLRRETHLPYVDIRAGLQALQRDLEHAIDGPRANDYWAAGDLAQIRALNGDASGAIEALQRFAACVPPPPESAYQAYRHLTAALADLATPMQPALREAQRWLEERIGAGTA